MRKSASKSAPLLTGIPAAPLDQVRETLEAHIGLQFELDQIDDGAGDGFATMNVLSPASGATCPQPMEPKRRRH